ncbi:YciI family protein [Paenibacillus soyae]|uniref:YciI family protein n=1 Tax=Paenibacillus soyae TaxID=2969249 RepID=A0A9X2MTD6_9BACL|nr:YciI family protein [Paenibacillus soyae]MCR2805922.1 YciI family protein [Paenibacillus soyae]
MKFMMIVKATKDSEAGVMPSHELLEAMQRYNEELAKAGVLLAADGLHSSAGGIRISYPEPGGKPKVVDGPFAETKEIIAGYTLIEVKSREEAIEWALRMPDPHGNGEGQIELRQVIEPFELTQDDDARSRLISLQEELDRAKRQ